MKDNFSRQASDYAKYRPDYPAELYEFIVTHVHNRGTAWDCGTGNGQCAVALSPFFDKVVATDISQQQLELAQKAPNIEYVVQSAEHSDIPDHSINLVTIAQAYHWLNFDLFFPELRRVAAPGALFAAWCYSLLQTDGPVNQLIYDFHYHTLERYWDPERQYIDDQYRTIPFPFRQIPNPGFTIEKHWTIQQLEGYFNTWSAVQRYVDLHHQSPVPPFMAAVADQWNDGSTKKFIFPVHLLLGAIE